MKSRRKWLLVASALLLLLPIVIATVTVGLQIRQENIDQALLKAVERLDASGVNQLLKEGANSNAREGNPPARTLPQIMKRLMGWLQPKPHVVDNDSGKTALCLLCDT